MTLHQQNFRAPIKFVFIGKKRPYNTYMIRRYTPQDVPQLVMFFSECYPDDSHSGRDVRNRISHIRSLGGLAWVVALEDGEIAAFAWITPVPGLPHIAELEGGVAVRWRRQGYGSRLLQHILVDLKGSQFKQLSFAVERLDSPAACLLQQQKFFVEHSENVLWCENITNLPVLTQKAGAQVVTFDRKTAVAHFTQLYNNIFRSHTWYQPYTAPEVADLLMDPDEMLFLKINTEISGFAWLNMIEDHTGVIEPLGIGGNFQGLGYGRYLLTAAMHKLAQQGAQRLQIGAWANNQPALHLYHSLGFQHHKTVTYLAHDLC